MARFALYSAHDNTIMALLAHLGLRSATVPLFAAYVAFEMHAGGAAAASPFVRVAYNAFPRRVAVPRQDYVRLPEGNAVVEYRSAVCARPDDASIPLAEFESRLFDVRGSFRSVAEWEAAGGVGRKAGEKGAGTEKKKKKGEKGAATQSPAALADPKGGATEEIRCVSEWQSWPT